MLTKQDIKCLRNADTICLDYANRNGEDLTGIRAILRGENSQTGYEQTHTIKAESNFQIYEKKNGNSYSTLTNKKPYSCYENISGPKYDPKFQTILDLLRENDTIVLTWFETSEGYLGAANCTLISDGYTVAMNDKLYLNYVQLTIIRENGKKLTFQLDSSITPNNSAKMIKI